MPWLVGEVSVSNAEDIEGREIAPDPGWPRTIAEARSFAERYEAWFDDAFPTRPWLLQQHSKWNRGVLGVSPSPQVVLGQDGWLFFTKEQLFDDYQGLTSNREAEAVQWRAALEARAASMKSRGVTYLFYCVPNKVTVMPERLKPRWRAADGARTRLDAISSAMQDARDVPFYDQRALLRGLPKDPSPYLRTDSHWSVFGAFASYSRIASLLTEAGEIDSPLKIERFVVDWWPVHGDLARLLVERGEKESHAFLHAKPPLAAKVVEPQSPLQLPKEWNIWEGPKFYENPAGRGRLLYIGDSFSWVQRPWFAEHFRNSMFISFALMNQEQLETLVDGLRPDVVIEQRAERNMKWTPTPPGRD